MTPKMTPTYYQLHTSIPGSIYHAGRIFRVIGEPVPDFVLQHGARLLGKLPIAETDPSIVTHDAIASAREAALSAATFAPKPVYYYRRPELKIKFGCDDLGLNALEAHYGLPQHRLIHEMQSTGCGIDVHTGSFERWDGRQVDEWSARLLTLVPALANRK